MRSSSARSAAISSEDPAADNDDVDDVDVDPESLAGRASFAPDVVAVVVAVVVVVVTVLACFSC